ncbi:acetate kinase [Facklamia sp. DSM 111018]|uniref:Acetate kinase n=1 Tax=Facklamia lactis TaxID=2749967 RepID=A0ABS0LNS2_9LACT|nr:acetate kinase [Facklamia lactis]MBG9979688.1 acetate kinase [Facklamia lactis]MBG9985632.1 acetate kinase [Facklamia lactis]
MSKTMAINAGSSSLKFQIIEMPEETVISKGLVERIGLAEGNLEIKYTDAEGQSQKFTLTEEIADHSRAVELLLSNLLELGIIQDFEEIKGVGHRVVAGGEIYKESTLVNEELIKNVEDLAEFAPLHNPAEAVVMRVFQEKLPHATMAAVFDTSFHTTMPAENYLYSLPYEFYENYSVRKYGAHGTSHQFVAHRAAEIVGKPIEDLRIITCHLGNGASITAVKNGESIDTSMGFTPLAGVTMGTRTGDIDASVIPFIMEKEGISDINEVINIFNKKSGLLGLSGVSSDMRDVEEAAEAGNERAQTALDIFYNRVIKYVGQYVAIMNGVDVVVFTAGIGENSKETREIVMKNFEYMGVKIDSERNNTRDEAIISTDDSTVTVINIPTNEEIAIARDVERLKAN